MSTERIINTDTKNLTGFTTPETVVRKRTARVDINHLLARVRKEKEDQNNINLIFFGFFLAVVIVAGVILTF